MTYLPKFQHALLNLTQCDPDQEERVDELRLVMRLMKLIRTKNAREFLRWFDQEEQRRDWQVPDHLVLRCCNSLRSPGRRGD